MTAGGTQALNTLVHAEPKWVVQQLGQPAKPMKQIQPSVAVVEQKSRRFVAHLAGLEPMTQFLAAHVVRIEPLQGSLANAEHFSKLLHSQMHGGIFVQSDCRRDRGNRRSFQE